MHMYYMYIIWFKNTERKTHNELCNDIIYRDGHAKLFPGFCNQKTVTVSKQVSFCIGTSGATTVVQSYCSNAINAPRSLYYRYGD